MTTNFDVNQFAIEFSRMLPLFMLQRKISFILSSYKTHMMLSLGLNQETNTPQVWLTNIQRPMGIGKNPDHPQDLWVCGLKTMEKFTDFGREECEQNGWFNNNFYPQLTYHTGDIGGHDTCITNNGEVYVCSVTLNSIIKLESLGGENNFSVFWTPPWITKDDQDGLRTEDRCHLNGLALRDDEPRYITAMCMKDGYQIWREHRNEGVVYDIKEDRPVCSNLHSPHSPRWYRPPGYEEPKLWILESGTGTFGYIDIEEEKFVPKTFIPGFLRGMDFVGNVAIVCTSKDRFDNSFTHIPLQKVLEEKETESKCGIWFISLETFSVLHHVCFQGITELYDVSVVRGGTRPRVISHQDELCLKVKNTKTPN